MTLDKPPRVTIAVANYNGGRFLEAALHSALAQTLSDIEVILVDDRSTDDSVARAQAVAAADPRLRVIVMDQNGGPGAARNRALDLARGEWFAVLDSDDLIHPQRFERMIAAAEADGADIVADNLMLFHEDNHAPATRFLDDIESGGRWIATPAYLESGQMFAKQPALGFLKPLIRRSKMKEFAIRYDSSLRIAEDDLLIMHMLAAGMRYRLLPDLGYFYRKHSSSISHRIAAHHLHALIDADARARPLFPPDPAVQRALDRRRASFVRALAFTETVTALKARRPLRAVSALAAQPAAIPLLGMLVSGAMAKLRQRRAAPAAASPAARNAVVISRRAGDAAAGLGTLAETLRAEGFAPYLIHLADPGRSKRAEPPKGERGFADIHQLFRAPGATTAWTDAERLFIATHARASGDRLIADGSGAAEGLIYALRPESPSETLTSND
jgi:succinoglycan biosynthesis protein ExoO